MIQLILGGARSGKSRLAEERALQLHEKTNCSLVYVATAHAGDDEMSARILVHQSRRDSRWLLEEASEDLASLVRSYQEKKVCMVIDCLTLWISNCLHKGCWEKEREQFLQAVQFLSVKNNSFSLILVSNEVGSGIVPLGELSREFVDASGNLHQALAACCSDVTLTVAGLPLKLK